METVTENLSRPGQEPEEGDWVRDTITYQDGRIAVVEYEFHASVDEE